MSRAGSLERGVCLTAPFAWPQVKRGTETLMRSLARWLRANDVDARILAAGPEPMDYELDGVPVTLVRARSLTRLHRDLDEETTFLPAMARQLRARRPSIVHSFLYGDAAAARLARVPYIVSFGGIALRSSFARMPVKYRVFQYAARGADTIVCPSAAAATHLDTEYGFRARIIPNGLDVAEYASDEPTDPNVVFCPSTPDDQRKRVSVLVDAFAIAAPERPALRLMIAGRASEQHREAMRDRLAPHLRDRVEFLGDVDIDAMRSNYARAAVTCLPSVNEAFGMVVVESLASGTPVVGADHGAIPEIIDETVGAVFTPDDPQGCARALLDTLARADAGAFERRCAARARTYDWSAVGPQFVRLYQEVAARSAR